MDKTEPNDKDVGRILRDTFNPQSESSAPGGTQPELVRTSALAVVACLLAVASLLLLSGQIWVVKRDMPASVRDLYLLTLLGTSVLAGMLGIAALVQIAASAGRRTGMGFACLGVAVPVAEVLLGVLIAAIGRIHGGVAFRMTCGTNLSGIGKAMLIYANDYEDELPRAGGPSNQWTGRVADWAAANRRQAYGLSQDNSGGQVSISASLYLLVKYAEVPPKSFLCGASSRKTREKGVTEFRLGMYPVPNKPAELVDFWDFGPNPPKHCSYAYHQVYGSSPLTVSTPPGFAVAGDRNPWMDSPSVKARDFATFQPDIPPYNGTGPHGLAGNTFRHQGQGQNVLFLDTHVEFEKRPYCGLDDDNIYTSWSGQDKIRGVPPKLGSVPADAKDSLLVNDPLNPAK